MRLPFSRDLSALFASDRHALLKILGGGVVGGLLGGQVAFQDSSRLSSTAAIVMTAIVVVIGMAVVAALLLRDVLRQRLASGQTVSPLLKWYLCKGVVSLALWSLTAFALAILYVTTL